MELFVTKASKQHRNMTFSPFVHPCINFFFDNIAARLKSRNAFPFPQQLSSLSRLIIFYRGEFDQDYLLFSFSWMKRGDWLLLMTKHCFLVFIKRRPDDIWFIWSPLEKKNGKGKYLFIGGEIEWRRQKKEVFGEGKYLVSGGEAEWRRERRKVFADGFRDWVF